MELHQRVNIPVPLEAVWHSLNDPSVLRQCLPGCETFEPHAEKEDSFEVALTAKVGPVKAKFKGELALSNVTAPHAYTISGEGKGGVAGFAKGGADVSLAALGSDQTLMTYAVRASVGGKLAQVGSRLVTGAARKMADDFFTRFVRLLSGNENLVVQIETLEIEKGGNNVGNN